MGLVVACNLYTARVGNVGSFFVAAHDAEQARAIAELWAADRNIKSHITIKRYRDSRPVFTPDALM